MLLIFKIILLLTLTIQLFITPVEIGFSVDITVTQPLLFRKFPICIFIADLLCRLNTGFYTNGQFV